MTSLFSDIRLSKYADNIANTKTNVEEGLEKGYTQPQLVTRQVILQIDNILNSEIEDNPYLKIFLTADNSFFNEGEKEDLINRATLLIKSQIIPAYVDLNNFLSDDQSLKQEFINKLGKAYQDIGFVALKGHFLKDSDIENIYKYIRTVCVACKCIYRNNLFSVY